MLTRRPDHPDPDPGAVPAGLPHEVATAELLALCEEFLRTAGPDVHDELRQFLTARGHHPITGPSAFIDALGFTALRSADSPAAQHLWSRALQP